MSFHNQDELSLEWAVRFERDRQPRMDGTTEETGTLECNDEDHARLCVERGLPLSGRNHRVVRRYVTEWEEV